MMPRTIPVVLISASGCYKTVGFKGKKYIGDPINIIKLFNDLLVDEVIVLGISNVAPEYGVLEDLVSEAFMPLTYGGGVTSVAQAKRIFEMGFEKVSLNRGVFDLELVERLIGDFGAQSIVASFDFKKGLWGRTKLVSKAKKWGVEESLEFALEQGFGEVLVQSVDCEGAFTGPSIEILNSIKKIGMDIPVIYTGGVASYEDLSLVASYGVDGIACGSLFSFNGKNRDSVLINYPTRRELKEIYGAV